MRESNRMNIKRKYETNDWLIVRLCFISLPILLCFATSCSTTSKTSNLVVACELPRMNVLYTGDDNPIKIAVSNYKPSEIDVSIDNGIIKGSNGNYVIRPEKSGKAIVTIKYKGKVVGETVFRVKSGLEYTFALQKIDGTCIGSVNKKRYLYISRDDLFNLYSIIVIPVNTDYDLKIEIIEFNLVIPYANGTVKEAVSNGNKFSSLQKSLISAPIENHRVYIEDIKVLSVDGDTMNLGSINIEISQE